MHAPRQPSRCTLLVHAPSSLLIRALLLMGIVGTTALWVLPARSGAQVIPLKTIPVATGDQFLVLPSERLVDATGRRRDHTSDHHLGTHPVSGDSAQ